MSYPFERIGSVRASVTSSGKTLLCRLLIATVLMFSSWDCLQGKSSNGTKPTPTVSPELNVNQGTRNEPTQNQTPENLSSPTPATSPINLNSPSLTTIKARETEASAESFSQLTLFLFGSGLALFIALLGWSDQIRGLDKDTRELEDRFLTKTGISKGHFVEIVKSGEPDKQLVALTQAINEGKIMSTVSVRVLECFDEYMTKLRPLERISDWKYKLTVSLTIALFVSGTISLFTNPKQIIFSIRVEMIVLVVPMIIIGALLVMIIVMAIRERALRSLLSSMSDLV